MQKALEQDSTVYDYDAVYDDIQNQRLETNKKILEGADKRVKVFFFLILGFQRDVMARKAKCALELVNC